MRIVTKKILPKCVYSTKECRIYICCRIHSSVSFEVIHITTPIITYSKKSNVSFASVFIFSNNKNKNGTIVVKTPEVAVVLVDDMWINDDISGLAFLTVLINTSK